LELFFFQLLLTGTVPIVVENFRMKDFLPYICMDEWADGGSRRKNE